MMNQLLMSVLAQRKSAPVSSENCVRFVSASSRTITPKYDNSGVTLQYSVDKGKTWNTIASGSETTSATEHWFRGQTTGTKSLFTSTTSANAWAFSGSSDLEVYGNLNYLLCDILGDEVAPTSLETYAYARMFQNCTSLTTAPELPATTLGERCYYSMFQDCTSLTTAPELPATTLQSQCYESMFEGCSAFKVSETQTGSYTYSWRIPTSGTGVEVSGWNISMLSGTGGTFTSNPSINKIYWVENEPI